MLSGIRAQDGMFLSELGHIEDRISKTNQQVTSGVRVAQAVDDPSAVMPILQFQSQIDRLTQVNTNLQRASTDIATADAALASASTILDRLNSLGTQGMGNQSTADNRKDLSIEVEQLENQLVSIANTSIGDRFIFGGNNSNVVPYQFDWTQPNGVVKQLTNSDPTYLTDGNGSTVLSGKTATEIFDLQDASGNPLPGNIFQAVHDLGQALANNNTSAIQTAIGSLKTATAHLGAITVYYGNVETWIAQANQNTSDQIAALQQSLSSIQDVDMPSAITQLTANQTALQVSLSAHASLSTKTLFDYLG
jgi:flagellar hook-associated protein 3 FlgL